MRRRRISTNRVIVAAAEVNNLYTFDWCYMAVL